MTAAENNFNTPVSLIVVFSLSFFGKILNDVFIKVAIIYGFHLKGIRRRRNDRRRSKIRRKLNIRQKAIRLCFFEFKKTADGMKRSTGFDGMCY